MTYWVLALTLFTLNSHTFVPQETTVYLGPYTAQSDCEHVSSLAQRANSHIQNKIKNVECRQEIK